MPDSLRINGHEIGFADHPTEGTVFTPGVLDTRVEIRLGRLYANLLTPGLDLSDHLPAEDLEGLDAVVEYLRLVTYVPLSVPSGSYGARIQLPQVNQARQGLEVYGLPFHATFHGTITVERGRLVIKGAIKGEGLALMLEAHKSFVPKELLPPRTVYSLDGAREAAPHEVYDLRITSGDFPKFPEDILRYTNLEYLFIGQRTRFTAPTLPPKTGELRNLRALLIYNHAFKEIPDELSKLVLLEELSLSGGELRTIPPSLGQLQRLRVLNLDYNQLEELPATLAELPDLRRISIAGNAFRRLPASLANVPDVKVDYKYKRLYTDTSYPTAHPGPIDHGRYNLKHYPGERSRLAAAIGATPALHPARSLLLDYARMATFLAPVKTDSSIPTGASKLGGAPDLPVDWAHPADKHGKLYIFHAQLNLAEFAAYQKYLPREGLLYFFVSDEEYAQSARVLYAPAGSTLRRFKYLDTTEFIDVNMGGAIRSATAIQPVNSVSIPELYNSNNYGTERYPAAGGLWEDLGEKELDAMEEAVHQLGCSFPRAPKHSLPFSERNYHALNTYVFTQHESPEQRAAERFGGEPADWCVLLNMESIGEFNFWDAGTLTYCIHKNDLAAGDFSVIAASIESS